MLLKGLFSKHKMINFPWSIIYCLLMYQEMAASSIDVNKYIFCVKKNPNSWSYWKFADFLYKQSFVSLR